MSILDKAIAAITPPESDEALAKARQKAEAAATSATWLAQILGHHKEIEAQFAALKAAGDPVGRRAEQEKLGLLLTGHSLAEEAAVYPALAADHQVGHAELAYQEQSAAKMEMGLLERRSDERGLSRQARAYPRRRRASCLFGRRDLVHRTRRKRGCG